jgi:hypothetical protein
VILTGQSDEGRETDIDERITDGGLIGDATVSALIVKPTVIAVTAPAIGSWRVR